METCPICGNPVELTEPIYQLAFSWGGVYAVHWQCNRKMLDDYIKWCEEHPDTNATLAEEDDTWLMN